MKKTLGFLLVATLTACQGPVGDKGEVGAVGDKGDKGDKGEQGPGTNPALAALTPATMFPGRTTVMQLSGVATHFQPSSSLVFDDPAIKVTKVEVGSNANLRFTVEVGLDAKLGPHDLSISSPPTGGEAGAEDLKLKGGLTIMPSLSVELGSGVSTGPSVNQGGLVDLAVRNQDYRDNPFWSQTRFAGPVSTIGSVSATTVRLSGTALVDALAPAGALVVGGATVGPFGQTIYYSADPTDMAAPTVKARAATDLKFGTAKTGESISDKRATNLYKLTTTADSQVVHMQFTSLGTGWSSGVRPIGYTAPASGKFSEGQAFDSWGVGFTPATRNVLQLVQKKGDAYTAVLASDQSGSMAHSYTVTAKSGAATAMTSLKEPMMGDSTSSPLATIAELDKAYYGLDGAIDAAYEDDYVKFKAKTAGKVYVQISSAAGPNIGVGLRDASCNVVVLSTQYSRAGSMGLEVDAKAGDTYCLRLNGDTAGTVYSLIISPAL